MNTNPDQHDVTVIGGGLAGIAASIHLARAGLRVLCIEGDAPSGDEVGESLDWSAPALLEALGLPMETLIAQGNATYKRHVILKLQDGSEQHYEPSAWLERAPFHVDLRTLHVDRSTLAKSLREIALQHGVKILTDKVVDIEKRGREVVALTTHQGLQIRSPWFIDASGGTARLFPRAFDLPVDEYGPNKVAIWSYFTVPESIEGTTLYATVPRRTYMDWVWQIPIHANTVSVGYVTTGDAIKHMRQSGLTVCDIYESQLSRFPPLQKLFLNKKPISPRVTSFRCRVHRKVSGPNWLVVGEAASMVDPMTSNGVTSAMRHAVEASHLIAKYRRRRRLPYLATTLYSWRVRSMASFFNVGIEKVMYDWPIREQIGPLTAGDMYTIPAWLMNLLYTRINPTGLVGTALFGLVLASLRSASRIVSWLCRRFASSPSAAVSPVS
ncbi:NAD(P)/FAD-dependent oxidoreductase [Granulicella arctica]|uniref:Flavin-dependent dehydrogenase n=1 Tax=Granulicella arctica TaxID=940613 RepID=A0A7Y9PF85_9BACT|nr:tryptophan 7-halogenase [Granulicella arctica]NYF78078.1 flavin-dependent dehydrogenase [Granulicella arctica]